MIDANDAPEHEHDHAMIASVLRASIERQIATTPEGKAIAESYPDSLAKLVTNIIGNATYAVVELIDDALATKGSK